MDNLTEKLSQLLNDPGSMKQIADMAAALGVTPGGELPAEFPAEMPEQVITALNQTKALDQKQNALAHALMPYLRPGRRERLERAMQVARLSHLAGAALRSGVPLFREEDTHV